MDTDVEAFGKGAPKRRRIEEGPTKENAVYGEKEIVVLPQREVTRVKRRVNGNSAEEDADYGEIVVLPRREGARLRGR